ncbi:MAG: D-alanyl-D-alanine carboxypeptidase/D-alanyl-D-alanine-endopeptidase [Bacteroidales bacterium]|nr:D-alanyl-D-alanine carboxypeptidase/D-alanyl-D-alanine-endopeptidase [Bacteroidales bacterium]
MKIVKPVIGMLVVLSSCLSESDHPGNGISLADSMPTDSLLADSLEAVSIPVDSLQLALDSFNLDTVLRNASFSYLIYDVTDDSILAEKDPDLSLVPASTIKLFTSAAALELLGPRSRFRTRLLCDGTIVNGQLKGNLIIKGGGDPTFCFGEQTMNNVFASWANALSTLHVDSVEGDILGDGSIFSSDNIPYTWCWGEINLGYSAAPAGLSINGNLFKLVFDPSRKGWVNPVAGRMNPENPNCRFLNNVVVHEGDKEIYLIGYPTQDEKMIRGTTNAGVTLTEVIGVMHDPALVAAMEFKKKLIEKGIAVSGEALSVNSSDTVSRSDSVNRLKEIAVIWSPTVNSIVYNVNHHSNNFFAEILLKHLGIKKYRSGSTEAGIRAVRSFLQSKGIDLSGFYMYDGSGISRYNSVTARQLVALLKVMQTSPVSENFRSSLSVAGVSGTLGSICTDPEIAGKIHGKSGTMTRIRSYAGYATSPSGHQLIFAIIANNFNCSSLEMRKKMEALLRQL